MAERHMLQKGSLNPLLRNIKVIKRLMANGVCFLLYESEQNEDDSIAGQLSDVEGTNGKEGVWCSDP